MPDKPTSAVWLLGWIQRAIQVPLAYNFLVLEIPEEAKDYVEIIPSD